MATSHNEQSGGFAWPAACGLLGIGCATVWYLQLSGPLAWQAESWWHQPWVLWSASLAHLSGAHLVGNLAALGVLAVLGAYLNAGRPEVLATLLAWPVGTLALVLWPQVAGYSGLSGLLCAMLAVLSVQAMRHTGTRAVSGVLLAAMGAKLLSEHAWSQPVGYDPHWGFNVVYAAHLSGFASGAGFALVLRPHGRQNTTAGPGTQNHRL